MPRPEVERLKRRWPFRNGADDPGLPNWMRHITPWWLLHWIFDHYHVCWANLVMWKLYGEDQGWHLDNYCFHPYDYCGHHDHCPAAEREAALRVVEGYSSKERAG